MDKWRDVLGRTALHRASLANQQEAVKALLDAKAATECVTDDGTTALMLAAQVGASDVCRTLLSGGASPSVRDDLGASAAEIAEEEGHSDCAKLCEAPAGPSTGLEGDRQLKVNFSVGLEHESGDTKQKVAIDFSSPDPDAAGTDLAAVATGLGLGLPEGCKSMVVADFMASDSLDDAGAGELQGMVEMIIDASLSGNELFLTFEAGLQELNGIRVYRLALFFNADWHATACEAQAPVQTLKQLQARLELDAPLLDLLEAQESGDDDPTLPEHVRCVVATLGVDEALLSSEMLSQLPKPVPEWVLEKIDSEMVPLKHAEAEVNLAFERKVLMQIMEDTGKSGMAKISALREAATAAPVELPVEFAKMIKGLLKANVVAEGGATFNMDFGGAMPVFQLLPQKEGGSDDDGGDDDSDWE